MPKAPKNFLSIENGQIVFSPNTWQMPTFLNPLGALIPKIPFSFFAEFFVRVTFRAWPGCRRRAPGVTLSQDRDQPKDDIREA